MVADTQDLTSGSVLLVAGLLAHMTLTSGPLDAMPIDRGAF